MRSRKSKKTNLVHKRTPTTLVGTEQLTAEQKKCIMQLTVEFPRYLSHPTTYEFPRERELYLYYKDRDYKAFRQLKRRGLIALSRNHYDGTTTVKFTGKGWGNIGLYILADYKKFQPFRETVVKSGEIAQRLVESSIGTRQVLDGINPATGYRSLLVSVRSVRQRLAIMRKRVAALQTSCTTLQTMLKTAPAPDLDALKAEIIAQTLIDQ